MKDKIIQKIRQRKSRIGIIGLGYVGLPLALEFAEKGFPVTGFDIDPAKIRCLMNGDSFIRHLPGERISKVFGKGKRANATCDYQKINQCDALIVCVPTPLTKNRAPDLSFITSTAEQAGPFLHRNSLVSLESTTYPGTTDEVLIPILESKSRLKAGKDFLVAYSPRT